MTQQATAQIGVTGLAVMGRNLARNLARHGFTVAVHNRSPERTRSLVAEHGDEGTFVPSEPPADFVGVAGAAPRGDRSWSRRARPPTRSSTSSCRCWSRATSSSTRGNAHFADTRRREEALRERGPALRRHRRLRRRGGRAARAEHHAGRLGGVLPTLGPMLREDRRAGRRRRRAARTSARTAPATSSRWCTTASSTPTCSSSPRRTTCCGPGCGRPRREIAEIFREWNTGELESFLIEITAEVLAQIDAATGKPFVDVVLDQAEQKGTGRWTVQIALDLGVPITGIAEAAFARSLSGHAGQREAARRACSATRATQWQVEDRDAFVEDVRQALLASQDRRVRAGLRPDPGRQPRVRLGHRPGRASPPSGGAAASSGPASWTASARRTTRSRSCRPCWSRRTSPTR